MSSFASDQGQFSDSSPDGIVGEKKMTLDAALFSSECVIFSVQRCLDTDYSMQMITGTYFTVCNSNANPSLMTAWLTGTVLLLVLNTLWVLSTAVCVKGKAGLGDIQRPLPS